MRATSNQFYTPIRAGRSGDEKKCPRDAARNAARCNESCAGPMVRGPAAASPSHISGRRRPLLQPANRCGRSFLLETRRWRHVERPHRSCHTSQSGTATAKRQCQKHLRPARQPLTKTLARQMHFNPAGPRVTYSPTRNSQRLLPMFSLSFDWRAATLGACVGILSVVTVSLAAANVPNAQAENGAQTVAHSHSAASARPQDGAAHLANLDTLHALAVAIFVAASAAGPIWLISAAHHPHPRARSHCTR